MITLNNTTKRAQNFIEAYKASYKSGLLDCYSTISEAKKRAYNSCLAFEGDMNGIRGRILSFNTFNFTYGFTADNFLYIITKSNYYKIPLSD